MYSATKPSIIFTWNYKNQISTYIMYHFGVFKLRIIENLALLQQLYQLFSLIGLVLQLF